MRVFGREPAMFVEMLVAVVLGVLLTLQLDPTVLGYANAAAVAVGGFVTAALVSAEKALPALVGVIKAVVALLLGLGVALPINLETGIIAIVSALGAFYIRSQVDAPVPKITASSLLRRAA